MIIEVYTSKISQLIIDNEKKLFSYNSKILLKGISMSDNNICNKIEQLRQAGYKRVPLMFRDENIII